MFLRVRQWLLLVGCLGLFVSPAFAENGTSRPSGQTFSLCHTLTVKDIPAGAKTVRLWFWFPEDDPYQKILEYAVPEAPANYQLTRDPLHGHRYLYAEVARPKGAVHVKTEFVIERQAARVLLDATKAGPLTEAHRTLFAEYLRKDCPCMEADDRIQTLADELCGKEINVVRQARRLFDWVVTNTHHYSKANAPKSSGQGSATYCLNEKGGGCTDQHTLFIALCRARGIPTRLQFGSMLRPQNEGKDVNPGYRCWVHYFVPNYGWVPADLSEANITGKHDLYFSGLDDRRVCFLEGRDLRLSPPQDGKPVNLFIIAYVEVDGRPHTAFERTLRFTEKRQ